MTKNPELACSRASLLAADPDGAAVGEHSAGESRGGGGQAHSPAQHTAAEARATAVIGFGKASPSFLAAKSF